MKKIKGLFKKKWFKILFIVLLVALVGVSAFVIIRKKNTNTTTQEFTYTRTVTLGYGSLNETVVADGTIESQNSSTITSSVSNATVSKINYSVGDYVKEGDVIIELDTTNLNKQITKTSEQITDQEDQLQDSYDDAYEAYESAQSAYTSAKATRDAKYNEYEVALNQVTPYQTTYDNAVDALNTFIDYAVATYTNKSISDIKNDTTIVDGSNHNYKYYNDAVETAKAALDAIKATTNYDSLLQAYNSAVSVCETAKTKRNTTETALGNAYDKLYEGVDTDTLDDLYDTAADYKLKAKSDGQITSIPAVLGSSASGTLATIQDTSKLKISLTIDEYDILKIELGMKCTIETDASDKTYEGVVAVISPVATNSMGSSGFEIEVNVTSEDVSDLLIGMNAEVTIIISSTDENFTVPMDAVETKEDGTQVIYVQDDNGDFNEVEVTTGENNGYYVEIFGDDLKTGMIVRASADASEAEVTVTDDEMSEEGFNMFSGMGGQGGGGMPSGGGGGMPSGGGAPSGGFNGN